MKKVASYISIIQKILDNSDKPDARIIYSVSTRSIVISASLLLKSTQKFWVW